MNDSLVIQIAPNKMWVNFIFLEVLKLYFQICWIYLLRYKKDVFIIRSLARGGRETDVRQYFTLSNATN
jgi:hypothetical protein